MGKWFYKAQENEIREYILQYDRSRLIDQQINSKRVYEKYFVWLGEDMSILLFEVRKLSYGKLYDVLIYKNI